MEKDNNYLMHYGRLGMKWYQHIYSSEPTTARQYKKKLNELDKASTYHMGQATKYAIDNHGLHEKINKRKLLNKAKGRAELDSKTDKYTRKIEQNTKKFDEHESKSKYYDEEIKRTWNKASEIGYKISSKNIYRTHKSGAQKVASILAGPIGYATVASFQEKKYGRTIKTTYIVDGKSIQVPVLYSPYHVRGTKFDVSYN